MTITSDALTNELVEVVTGYSAERDASRFRACREAASRDLRHHRFPRINQFEVRNSLDGLVEKFHILNNERLADRLDEKLKELAPRSTNLTPEILSLFLLLSDNPLAKANVDDTNSQRVPTPPPPLTWEDLLVQNPQDEAGIWDEVDFRAGSEDEDDTSLTGSTHSTETRRSSYTEESPSISAESFILPVQSDKLTDLLNYQSLLKEQITELQIVRQTLHMLLGLPSSVYANQASNGQVVVRLQDTVPGVSQNVLAHLLNKFALIGTDVSVLRNFSRRSQRGPLLQTFSACVNDKVQEFNKAITETESNFVSIKQPTIVSIIKLESQVELLHNKLSWLKEIIMAADDLSIDKSHDILDTLFDYVLEAQATGETEAFVDITNMFLRCLRTYLRPLSTWMEEGELHGSSSVPFVSNSKVDMSSFWQQRFSIVKDQAGNPLVPKFLLGVIDKIFASGKSVAFLKELGLALPTASHQSIETSMLNFDNICGPEPAIAILPFSHLLNETLQSWMASKHHHTWLTLQQHLLRPSNGLITTLEALEHLYLSADGSRTSSFTSAIFAKLDAGKSTWCNSFFLEDLARSSFGSQGDINACSIVRNRDVAKAISQRTPRKDLPVKALSIIANSITYTYPAHIHNIVPPATALPIYRAASTLLRQLARPLHLITQHRLIAQNPQSLSHSINSLSQRLRHTLINTLSAIRSHLIFSTIAPGSRTLYASIATADSVDEMITAHATFMERIERGCLLVKQVEGMRGAVVSLAELGVVFARLCERLDGDDEDISPSDGVNYSHDDSDTDTDTDTVPHKSSQATRKPNLTKSLTPLTPQETITKLKQMSHQHDQLLAFMIAGLRTAARSSEGADHVGWSVLAEGLEWCVSGRR